MIEQKEQKKWQLQEGMYFKEQHEYFLDLFSLDKDAFSVSESGKNIFDEGTIKDFRLKTVGFVLVLFLLRFMLDIQLPAWFEIIALGVACFILVEGVIRVVTGFNDDSKKTALPGIFKYIFILFAAIVVISYVG